MFNQTRQNLISFDNEHEFERLAADVLNSLGYENVEPMAPLGGADGGTDILYSNGESKGIAFVTLRKDIRTKFLEDLEKYDGNSDEIALFSIVDITPKQKTDFTNLTIEKNVRLEFFDVERIRSLFDSTLKDLRRKYLGIDDELSIQIKDKLYKFINYRNTQIITIKEHTILEAMLTNKLPQKIFHLLMGYRMELVKEVPVIGINLEEFLIRYDGFIGKLKTNEEQIINEIGKYEKSKFREAWKINYRYSMMRFFGATSDVIQNNGDFLNYGITWDSAETIYRKLVDGNVLEKLMKTLLSDYEEMCELCENLLK